MIRLKIFFLIISFASAGAQSNNDLKKQSKLFNKDSIFKSTAEIKVNLISAVILIPNIGIEVKLSEKLSYQLDTSSVSYDQMEGSPFHATQIFNELRYYPRLKAQKNQRSFFIGPHWGYGMFTLRVPKFFTYIVDTGLKEEGSYQSGRNTYYGITVGKKIPLRSKKLNLEVFIGGGSSQSYYRYYNKLGNRIYLDSGEKRMFNNSGEELIYRGGLMLTFKI